MAKTETELRSMGFKQLKDYCKTVGVNAAFGGTKGAIIKSILAADPPPMDLNNKQNDDMKIEVPILRQYVNDDDYKSNQISLKKAIKIVKKNAPKQLQLSIYSAFSQLFGYENWANLSVNEFANAVATCNTQALTSHCTAELYKLMDLWTNANGIDGFIAVQRDLKGFVAPPNSAQKHKLMFAIFKIDNVTRRLSIGLDINNLFTELEVPLNTMNTFTKCMKEIMNEEIYQKILLSSIVIAKFRNRDINVGSRVCYGRVWKKLSTEENLRREKMKTMKHNEGRFLNVIDCFNKISVALTPTERFQAKKWDSLKENGTLHESVLMLSVMDHDQCMSDIRNKAISFGSAIDPPILNSMRLKKSKQEKLKEIENEIGSRNVEQKIEIENKLNMVLGGGSTDDGTSEGVDLSVYHKMKSLGITMGAIEQKMMMNGVSKDVIAQFITSFERKKEYANEGKTLGNINDENRPNYPSLPTGIIAGINQHRVPANAIQPAPVPPRRKANKEVNKKVNGVVPVMHDNQGLVFDYICRQIERVRVKLQTASLNLMAFDQELYQQMHDGDGEEEVLHDESFQLMMSKIDDVNDILSDFYGKKKMNEERLKTLDVIYHSKFRPMILKQVTASRYSALIEAIEMYDINVSVGIIGRIWMFVKPFDELIELKFAVDCISEYFEKEQLKINLKKLPLQSHRGYEANYDTI